jgi:short-chain fatty acids transporter
MIRKITDAVVLFFREYLPSTYVLALILTILVFLAGVVFTDQGFMGMVNVLGNGMWGLLAFTMQIVLSLVFAHALANAPSVLKLLRKLARIPKTRTQAVLFVSFSSLVCTYIHWGFGLVAGALLAKEIATLNSGKKIDYPLLVAAAYSGNIMRGPSSNVFLGPSSAGHVAEKFVGVIPLSETLFSIENIILSILLFIGIPILYKLMQPDEKNSLEIKVDAAEIERVKSEIAVANVKVDKKHLTFSEKLDEYPIIQYILAALFAIFLFIYFSKQTSFNLSLDVLNLLFLVLGLIAHKTPSAYAKAIKEATKTADGIILQFPFYAAIMVMLRDTGMSTAIAEFFVSISTARTLPVFSFLAASVINVFIPSAGGLWAIQGPIMLEAAKLLGANEAAVIVGMGWGDSWTSQIQPFWALPLLAIAGLDVNDIMGYCFMVLLLSGVLITGTLLIM